MVTTYSSHRASRFHEPGPLKTITDCKVRSTPAVLTCQPSTWGGRAPSVGTILYFFDVTQPAKIRLAPSLPATLRVRCMRLITIGAKECIQAIILPRA